MKPLAAVDIETRDLSARYDPDCPVWSVAVVSEDDKIFIPWDSKAPDYLNILSDKFTFVFHNGSFDVPALRIRGVDIPYNTPGKILWYDTMLMSYALAPSNHMYHSLGMLAHLVDEEKEGKPNFDRPDMTQLRKYNIQDARITLKLAHKFLRELQRDEQNWMHFHEIEQPYTEIIIQLERGITINRKELAVYEKSLQYDTGKQLSSLQAQAGVIPTAPVEYAKKTLLYREEVADRAGRTTYRNIFTGINSTTKDGQKITTYDHCPLVYFNPNSGDHIANYLEEQGYEFTKFTAKGKPKTDAKTLEPLQLKYPLLKELAAYKKMYDQLNTFVRPIGTLLDHQSVLRGSFNQCNVSTRRLSSSNPNLQNIPARGDNGANIRRMFVAKPDHKLVVGDLDRIEVCVLAFYLELLYDDKVMSDAVRAGIDVHQVNADNWGIARKEAKNTFFCLLYGGGEQRIALTAGIQVKQAKQILASIEKNAPALLEFREYVCEVAMENDGYFHDWLGGRYYVPDIMSDNNKVHHAARRKIANYCIQGTAGSIFKKLQLAADPTVMHYDASLKIVVHDESIYECSDDKAQAFADELTKCYTNDKLLMEGSIVVPISAKFHCADNWYDAKVD